MRKITIILFILLISCAGQSGSVGEQNNTNGTSDKFNFLIIIRDGQIGNLKIGEQVTDAVEKLDQFIVVRNSIPECEACDSYSPIYKIYNLDKEEIFAFEPG